MGARVYDPYSGTFLQTDLLSQGPTPYGYTAGDPVNETDLSGKAWNPSGNASPLPGQCMDCWTRADQMQQHLCLKITCRGKGIGQTAARLGGDVVAGGVCIGSDGFACGAALAANATMDTALDITARGQTTGQKLVHAGIDIVLNAAGFGAAKVATEMAKEGASSAARAFVTGSFDSVAWGMDEASLAAHRH
jgi:hypothetical protein